MSRVRADKLVDRNATGAPSLTYGAEVPVGYGITGAGGINITGVATAASFSGNLTGNATGLTGSPDITITNLTGVAATFTGALTYEDVTNVDSTGIVTAGKGVRVTTSGVVVTAGITTVKQFDATGTLVEAFSSTTTAWSSSADLNITNGNVQFSSANLGGTNNTLNLYSTTGINTDLAINQTLTVTGITAVNASTAYVNKITVDGVATGITTHWVGGEIPSEGGDSGVDLYTFNLLKTGSSTYIIVANHSKTSS